MKGSGQGTNGKTAGGWRCLCLNPLKSRPGWGGYQCKSGASKSVFQQDARGVETGWMRIRHSPIPVLIIPAMDHPQHSRDKLVEVLRAHGINPTHQRIEIA